MVSFANYVQNALYNELFACANKFIFENKDKLDLGGSLRKAGFMRYNTLRRTMSSTSEIYLLESHLESMILMNDSKMILFFRKAQEIQGASWNIKK